MSKFILGEKIGMGEMHNKKGKIIPVTLIKAGPCNISQVKTTEKDGYSAVQMTFGKKRKINKPQKGHLKKLGIPKCLKEFKILKDEEKKFKVGSEVKADIFKEGEKVVVSGFSKGKGFQGVVKRHGFKGSPASHGHRHDHRSGGSIGGAFPERVVKGRKMPGRMGHDKVTMRNLEVMQINKDKNILVLKGSLPGSKGTLISIFTK